MNRIFDFGGPGRASSRGYVVVYRDDQPNHCPGCGRSHWYIGRISAECSFCGLALPLMRSCIPSGSGGHSRNRKDFEPSAFAA